MSKRARAILAATAMLGLFGLVLWWLAPTRAIAAIANLSDPAKLATLGKRGANPRLNKILYWLDEARRGWMSPATAISAAQLIDWVKEPRASAVKAALLRNLKIADGLGLLTPENRERLRHGHAAHVTLGPYAGEPVEIDHIVPLSLAPELGNELANLELLPQTLNRQKADRVTERQLDYAGKLLAAGLLTPESFARVKARMVERPRQSR